MRSLRAILFVAAALLVSNPLAVRLCAPRTETLAPEATITIGARSATVDSIARENAPALFDDPALSAGPLRAMLYEARAVESGGRLEVLYRSVWDDERHPYAAIDFFYGLFRRFYFGTRIDVEYVLLEIDTRTGAIAALDYQTEPSLRADVFTPAHARVHETAPRRPIELSVVTWNHMLARREAAEATGRAFVRARPEIRPVTDGDRLALYLPRATYAHLVGFGPLGLFREAPLHAAFVLAALGLARIVGRRRRAATKPPRGGSPRQAL